MSSAFLYAYRIIFQNSEIVSDALAHAPVMGSPTVKVPYSVAHDWGFRWSEGNNPFIDCAQLDDNLTINNTRTSKGDMSADACNSDVQVMPHFGGSCSLTSEEKAYFNMTTARAIGIICGPKDIIFFSRQDLIRPVHTKILQEMPI